MKRLLPAAFAACLFALIVGAKWATLDRYGSPMPDWDQWDAEGSELLLPWFKRDNFLSHLLHPHNEHRVIMTKLQNLALTVWNGQWDARVQAVANALVHAALAVAFWLFAWRAIARRWLPAFFVLLLALFACPVAWQNVLGGFHSQQYWLAALSFGAIVTLPFARPGGAAWWGGTIAAVLALGTMGSGFLAAAVVVAVLAWRCGTRELPLRAAWPTLTVAGMLVALGLAFRVEVEWHRDLKAKSVHDFVFSLLHSLQWPWREKYWAAFVLWFPWLLLAWHVGRAGRNRAIARSDAPPADAASRACTRDQAAPERYALAILALGGWVLVQLLATAYARGAGADYPASRYMDTLTFGAAANGLALGWLLGRGGGWRTVGVPAVAGLAWLLTLGFGLHNLLWHTVRWELVNAKAYYTKAESHLQRYLASDNPHQLAYPDIPYPSADSLMERLGEPILRERMPVPLRAPLPLRPAPDQTTVFRENDARLDDSERPPRSGLSPATAPLDAQLTWGSFGPRGLAEQGTWRSAPLATEFRWLRFETAGDLGPPYNHAVSLALHDAATGEKLADVAPSRRPRDSWRSAYVRAPDRPFVVVASDASSGGWVAFSAPVEMGGLSHLGWQATKHGLLIMYVGATATLGLLGLALWRRRR